MSIILFIIALVLVIGLGIVFLPLTLVYYLVTLKWRSGFKAFEKWMLKLAISLDQLGNVLVSVPFEYIFTKKLSYPFGNEDETISFVIAVNRNRNSLTIAGKALAWLLDFLDKDHLYKAIAKQQEHDLRAKLRFNNNDY